MGHTNLYLRSLSLVLQLDVTYALGLSRYQAHYEAARRILSETSGFLKKVLYPTLPLAFQCRAIQALLLKSLCIEKMRGFQTVSVMEKGFKQKHRMYKRLPEAVPNDDGGLLSGYQMQRLPNFSKFMARDAQPLLLEAKQAAETALAYMQA